MTFRSIHKAFVALLAPAVLLCALFLAHTAFAQPAEVNLSAELTEAEFQAMLGRLSDEQVRDILIAEFAARRTEDVPQDDGLLTNTREIGEALTTNAAALFAKLPELGAGFGAVFSRLGAAGGVGVAALALALSLLAGGVCALFLASACRSASNRDC